MSCNCDSMCVRSRWEQDEHVASATADNSHCTPVALAVVANNLLQREEVPIGGCVPQEEHILDVVVRLRMEVVRPMLYMRTSNRAGRADESQQGPALGVEPPSHVAIDGLGGDDKDLG